MITISASKNVVRPPVVFATLQTPNVLQAITMHPQGPITLELIASTSRAYIALNPDLAREIIPGLESVEPAVLQLLFL
jgi:hypothetical protein